MFKVLIFNRRTVIIPENGVITCLLNILYNLCDSLPVETFSALSSLYFWQTISQEKRDRERDWEEDADLVRKFKNGNNDAYWRLYDKYNGKIYRYCYFLLSRLNDPKKEAEDAMKIVFIKCYEAIFNLREESKFYWWLRKAAYGMCMDILKRSGRFVRIIEGEDEEEIEIPAQGIKIEDIVAPGKNPEVTIRDVETKIIVWDALNKLGEKYRLAIIHVHLSGYSHKETAEIMKCKEQDIKNWVHRGLLKLRETLKPYRELAE